LDDVDSAHSNEPARRRFAVKRLWHILSGFLRDNAGATLVEYGILLLIIAALSLVTISSIGGKVSKGFETVNSTMP
jgi:Flp pilus assembly pilin Flp